MEADFAKHVHSMRERLGLSQRSLAELSGVHQPTIAAIETGRRQPSPNVRAALESALRERPSVALDRCREELRRAVARHGGSDPRVFGSVARGEDTPGSDLDLIVTMPKGTDLLDVLDLTDELEAIIGSHVDIASGRAAGAIMNQALNEAVPL